MKNELTVQNREDKLVALTGGAGLSPEEIAEELGGDIPEYPRVKIPAGGAISFEIPSDDPERPDAEKAIVGVVVHHHKSNSYWASGDLSDTPPDCNSMDGLHGNGTPGGDCTVCQLNCFGSGEGGVGKACKNMERIYILREGDIIPLVLFLPPTSLHNWKNYKVRLVTKGKRVCDVFTEISLLKKTSKDGKPYAEAQFKSIGELSLDMAQKSYRFRQSVKELVQAGYDATIGANMEPNRSTEVPKSPIQVDAETGEVIETSAAEVIDEVMDEGTGEAIE